MGTIMVTGGLGFLGAPLCEALADRGESVVCVDRLSGCYSAERGRAAASRLAGRPGVTVLIADACEVELDGLDGVVHLAALPGVRTRRSLRRLWRDNVELTRVLVRRAARANARLLLASSSSVYGDAAVLPTPEHAPPAPLGHYARSKLAAEEACFSAVRELGADGLAVRPFTVFGPGQRPDMAIARWTRALLNGSALDWRAHANGARELTYVDDAVAGILFALDHGRAGEAYNVGGCGSHRLADVLALLERATGRSAALRRSRPSAGEAAVTAACGVKSGALGYRPGVSLEEGLRRQVTAAVAAAAVPVAA
jgi:UDP-glucuronate 4-epimerase